MKIFIDPGHNYTGADTGAQGYGLKEQDITFKIANKLKELLQKEGHQIKMSRPTINSNIGPSSISNSINARAQMANEWGANLFISIHCNAFDKKTNGTEVLLYSLSGAAAAYASRIQASIVSKLGTADRGLKERKDLGVLRKTNMPALLVETAFIDNESDNKLLKNSPDKFAEAIYSGITGKDIEQSKTLDEITDINDIVWEYGHRGLITDKLGMIAEMETNPNGRLYWLARKTLAYMRGHNI